jgi:hypothetical protein
MIMTEEYSVDYDEEFDANLDELFDEVLINLFRDDHFFLSSIGYLDENPYASLNKDPNFLSDEEQNDSHDEKLNETSDEKLNETSDEKLNETSDEELNETLDEELNETLDEELNEISDEELNETLDEELNETSDEELNKSLDENQRESLINDSNMMSIDTNILICPITQQYFYKPVICSDGIIYEEAELSEWFERNDTSPLFTKKLETKKYYECIVIKTLVEQYFKMNPTIDRYFSIKYIKKSDDFLKLGSDEVTLFVNNCVEKGARIFSDDICVGHILKSDIITDKFIHNIIIYCKNTELCIRAIDKMCDLNSVNESRKFSLIFYIIRFGDYDLLKYALETKNFKLDVFDNNKWSVLHYIARYAALNSMECFLDKFVQDSSLHWLINTKEKDGWSPFQILCSCGTLPMIQTFYNICASHQIFRVHHLYDSTNSKFNILHIISKRSLDINILFYDLLNKMSSIISNDYLTDYLIEDGELTDPLELYSKFSKSAPNLFTNIDLLREGSNFAHKGSAGRGLSLGYDSSNYTMKISKKSIMRRSESQPVIKEKMRTSISVSPIITDLLHGITAHGCSPIHLIAANGTKDVFDYVFKYCIAIDFNCFTKLVDGSSIKKLVKMNRLVELQDKKLMLKDLTRYKKSRRRNFLDLFFKKSSAIVQ